VVIKKKLVDPASLVRHAVTLRDNDLLAAKKNISLAVSSPCCEVWVVLHFTNQSGSLVGQWGVVSVGPKVRSGQIAGTLAGY
jgi:hypothetical protein